ncbi:Protein-lysine N-methyltransferase EEF2KMT [Channa argus]|uniref:Protein-lysine N-methyltransferase EEF2KMT n=1 Tax=Channa argus TaxID=215402 RepID=A0A6G1QBF8_CHAAH|nr:Protein-lysine N-methyltransferase EEF2KMT [Channa argus]
MSVSKLAQERLGDYILKYCLLFEINIFYFTFHTTELRSKHSTKYFLLCCFQTCFHALCRKFPPSVNYRKRFLTELIRRQETVDHAPLDELYDALADVVGAEEKSECYKSYLLPCGDTVSLLENVALISEGTTGLVTWEAALYLAEWALDHQQVFTGRTILELGSGVGFTGITICRSCSPKKFIFSDCHTTVLEKLRDNVQLNGLTEKMSPAVSVEELDWMTVTKEQIKEMEVNTVIAADVVYHPDIVESLVKLLSKILSGSAEGAPKILICSTIRNSETYSGFKQQLEAAGISHHVITGPVRKVFPYNRDSFIEMITLYK